MYFTSRPRRLNRLPYHIRRFQGPKIFIIYALEEELSQIHSTISTITDSSVTFIFYIPSSSSSLSQPPTFVKSENTSSHIVRKKPFYPINLLRDLAIEYIQTTHYLFLDCDILISSNCSMNNQIIYSEFGGRNEYL